ncbi:hypothetical protein Tco_0532472 [Tanacetum coccineum]
MSFTLSNSSSNNVCKGTQRTESGVKRAFGDTLGQDIVTSWVSTIVFQYVDQLEQHLTQKEFQEIMIPSYALSWKPCQGDSLNLPDHRIHKDGDGDASFQLESNSLPHAHAQTTRHLITLIVKNHEMLKNKDKDYRANSDIKRKLLRNQVFGRLFSSFLLDAGQKNGNPDLGIVVEYQKALLVSLDVSALDKPHIKLENLSRSFISRIESS